MLSLALNRDAQYRILSENTLKIKKLKPEHCFSLPFVTVAHLRGQLSNGYNVDQCMTTNACRAWLCNLKSEFIYERKLIPRIPKNV